MRHTEICIGATTFTVGIFALLFSVFLSIPLLVNILTNSDDVLGFTVAVAISAILGMLFILNGKRGPIDRVEGMYMTCFVWIMLALIAAVPFAVSTSTSLSYSDALFEAMSGLTTTGATVLCNLQEKSPGILLWRTMLHAIGGLGIITVGIVLVPLLKVPGLQSLYYTESTGRTFQQSTFKIILYIVCVYAALNMLCITAYWLAGMSIFDAICHGFSTISTGGFSNYDDSLMHFNSAKIEILAVIFMLLASCPFIVYIQLVLKCRIPSKHFLSFVAITLGFGLLASISPSNGDIPRDTFLSSLRYSTFTIVSFSTSTGFFNCNYNNWHFVSVLGTILTTCGGCSGSTNGGIKMHRIMLLLRGIGDHLRSVLRVSRHSKPLNTSPKHHYNQDSSFKEVSSFFSLYLLIFCSMCIVISWSETDFSTIITSVSSTLSNTGIGVGEYIGPSGSFINLSLYTKITLVVLMLTGRLEIIPIIAFFSSTLRIGVWKMLKIFRTVKILDMFP